MSEMREPTCCSICAALDDLIPKPEFVAEIDHLLAIADRVDVTDLTDAEVMAVIAGKA